jgi:hypothetical protein
MGISLNLNPRIRYSDLGGEQQRRANEDAYWHKAGAQERRVNVCFSGKSRHFWDLHFFLNCENRHRVTQCAAVRPSIWERHPCTWVIYKRLKFITLLAGAMTGWPSGLS